MSTVPVLWWVPTTASIAPGGGIDTGIASSAAPTAGFVANHSCCFGFGVSSGAAAPAAAPAAPPLSEGRARFSRPAQAGFASAGLSSASAKALRLRGRAGGGMPLAPGGRAVGT